LWRAGRLGTQQPTVGPPVERARALIQRFGVAPHVSAVRSQRAGILRRAADIEQRIPLTARLAVLALGEEDQRRDTCCREPLAVVDEGLLERGALGRLPSAVC